MASLDYQFEAINADLSGIKKSNQRYDYEHLPQNLGDTTKKFLKKMNATNIFDIYNPAEDGFIDEFRSNEIVNVYDLDHSDLEALVNYTYGYRLDRVIGTLHYKVTTPNLNYKDLQNLVICAYGESISKHVLDHVRGLYSSKVSQLVVDYGEYLSEHPEEKARLIAILNDDAVEDDTSKQTSLFD